MRDNIERLIELMNEGTVKAYRVSKATGMSEYQLKRLKDGDAHIGKMRFENAEVLSNYYKKVELEMKINEIRKELENTERSYYIEYYANIEEALEEFDMNREELYDRVSAVGFEIIEDVPVVIYDNPTTTLFNVAFITEDMTTEDILNELE